MKEKFYLVINFLNKEIHFFEYLGYVIAVSFSFYLFEYYNLPIKVLEMIIGSILGMAFMNTWVIQSKNYLKNKDCDNND